MTDYGKSRYSDAIAEAAEFIVLDGFADAELGSVEYGGEHYALVTLTADALVEVHGGYGDWSAPTLLIGARVILRTDSQGFVDTFYGPAHPLGDPAAYRALMAAWAEIENAENGSED